MRGRPPSSPGAWWQAGPWVRDKALTASPSCMDVSARCLPLLTLRWEMFKAVSIHRLVDFAVAARAGEVGTHEVSRWTDEPA